MQTARVGSGGACSVGRPGQQEPSDLAMHVERRPKSLMGPAFQMRVNGECESLPARWLEIRVAELPEGEGEVVGVGVHLRLEVRRPAVAGLTLDAEEERP